MSEIGLTNMNGDPQLSHLSKGAKRRKQRDAAKQKKMVVLQDRDTNSTESFGKQTLEGLKSEFQKAKLQGDEEKANVLRQRIWLAQDMVAGVKSDISPELQNEILMDSNQSTEPKQDLACRYNGEEIDKINQIRASTAGFRAKEEFLNKQLRKLQKKKTQINELKTRLQNGEALEATQIAKINRDKDVEERIDDVEEELYNLRRQ